MAATASATTIHFKDGYAEATSPNGEWHVTSNWTDEICKKTKALLCFDHNGPYTQPLVAPMLANAANYKINSARERMVAGISITRFAILDRTRVKVIGECGLEFSLDPDNLIKMKIDCTIHYDYQGKGIATWLMNLLLREYLPAIKFPVYPQEQKNLPWNKKKASAVVDASTVPVSALVHKDNIRSLRLMQRYQFKGAEIKGAPSFTIYEFISKQPVKVDSK